MPRRMSWLSPVSWAKWTWTAVRGAGEGEDSEEEEGQGVKEEDGQLPLGGKREEEEEDGSQGCRRVCLLATLEP